MQLIQLPRATCVFIYLFVHLFIPVVSGPTGCCRGEWATKHSKNIQEMNTVTLNLREIIINCGLNKCNDGINIINEGRWLHSDDVINESL